MYEVAFYDEVAEMLETVDQESLEVYVLDTITWTCLTRYKLKSAAEYHDWVQTCLRDGYPVSQKKCLVAEYRFNALHKLGVRQRILKQEIKRKQELLDKLAREESDLYALATTDFIRED